MAWGDLAGNQMVSFTDAQSSGFILNGGQNHVTSNQCMTKDDWIAKYNIVAGNLSGLAGNQLVQKSLLSSVTVYSSAFYSESATKNNCPVGYTGTSVTLTASVGQFTSTVSQADADNQAVAWVQANKQSYANFNGACIGNALTINYSVNEQLTPFTDANVFIGNSRTGTVEQFNTGNFTVGAISGDSVNVVANSFLEFPWPANSTLRLIVKVNGSEVNNTTTNVNGQNLNYNIGVVNSTNTYEIIVTAITTEPETLNCGPNTIDVFEQGSYFGFENLPLFGTGSINHDVYKTQRTVVISAGTVLTPTLVLTGSPSDSGYHTYKQIIIRQSGSVIYDSGNYLTDGDTGNVGIPDVVLTPTINISSSIDLVIEMYTKIYAT